MQDNIEPAANILKYTKITSVISLVKLKVFVMIENSALVFQKIANKC